MQSYNPATGEVVFQVEETSKEELKQKILSLQKGFDVYSETSFEERVKRLLNYQELLKKEADILTEAISKENGKPLWEAKSEVLSMINKVEISIQAYKERCPEKQIVQKFQKLISSYRPHGVVAVFGPFNFPGHLPNGHIVPALLAGNAILFKPSEFTPLVGNMLCNYLKKCNFPIEIAFGGPSVGKEMIENPAIQGIFFTGSAKTGGIISETVAKSFHKILALELGGNNPLIVSTVDNLDDAVKLTIQSAFLTSGQRCSCLRRLILPKQAKREEFLSKLVAMAKNLKIGPYTDKPEPFMGPLIHNKAADAVLKAEEELIKLGGKSLLKMKRLKENAPFLSAGILDVTDIQPPDEEIFGPLLKVILVDTLDKAIEKANETSFGLTAGIFTNRKEEFDRYFKKAKAGVVNWNTAITGVSSHLPFGGVGISGNHRPSGFLSADYCSYPVASCICETLMVGEKPLPGMSG